MPFEGRGETLKAPKHKQLVFNWSCGHGAHLKNQNRMEMNSLSRRPVRPQNADTRKPMIGGNLKWVKFGVKEEISNITESQIPIEGVVCVGRGSAVLLESLN